MAVCGRCFLCNEKFECVPKRSCESCAEKGEEPAMLQAPYIPSGHKVCHRCVVAIGTTSVGDVVAGILNYLYYDKVRGQ